MSCVSKAGEHPKRSLRKGRRYIAGLWIGLCVSGSYAAENEGHVEHLHEPLPASSALLWPELIDESLKNFPHFVELAARSAEAATLSQRGSAWLSGPISVFLAYQSDKTLDDTDLREYEAGLELPLWRPGQRDAAQFLAQVANSETEAASSAMRHEVIGLLRLMLWEIERAVITVSLAEDSVNLAAERVRVVERRFEAGELPESDTLLAHAAMMEREVVLIDAEAELLDAERAYRSLTGLDIRPANIEESLSSLETFDSSHPLLALADADISRASAERKWAAETARGMPTLTVGTRREQGAFTNFYTDSVGVGISVPFGGKAHRNAEAAAVDRSVAQARAARASVHRQLDLDLHEAEHSLAVIDESMELAQERFSLSARYLQMSEIAFSQGEITLFELLRQDEIARAAERDVARLEVARFGAIALFNQAIGEWP